MREALAAASSGLSTSADDLRSQLVDAALHLLSEHGPTGVRIRDVAARAGCSTMGVYTHFGSKDGLLDELFRLGFEQLSGAIGAVAPSSDHPRVSVVQLALAYRRAAIANPALYALMFERAMPDFTPSREVRTQSLAPFDLLVEAIRRCHVPSPDAARIAYLFWCALHGLVSIELTHRRWGGPVMEHLQNVDSEQAFSAGAQAILDGLLHERGVNGGPQLASDRVG